MSRTDRIGGHNALLKRWIKINPSKERHSIVVLEFLDPDETELAVLAESTGGEFISLVNVSRQPLESAYKLRTLAWETANCVVLHHHMWDIVPAIAFGISGGPPVFLMNMADHLFWPGSAVVDCLLELRADGAKLSEQYRGLTRSYLLQVPLPDRRSSSPERQGMRDARKLLGIDADATVFLTVGRAPKYEPREGIDFLSTAISLLKQVPNSYLIAVGPSETDGAWLQAKQATNGRLLAIGNQADLRLYHEASDIYLEGFPFGSLTALLEAGLAGLPCVRAPNVLPPVFRATGSAIEHLPVPDDPAAYVREAVSLAQLSAVERSSLGRTLAAKIDSVHYSGWIDQLAGIPILTEHRVYEVDSRVAPLPLKEAKLLRWLDGDPLASIFWKAQGYGMRCSIDRELVVIGLRSLLGARLLLRFVDGLITTSHEQPKVKLIS